MPRNSRVSARPEDHQIMLLGHSGGCLMCTGAVKREREDRRQLLARMRLIKRWMVSDLLEIPMGSRIRQALSITDANQTIATYQVFGTAWPVRLQRLFATSPDDQGIGHDASWPRLPSRLGSDKGAYAPREAPKSRSSVLFPFGLKQTLR